MIVIASPLLVSVTLVPATKLISSSTPAPELPPEVNLTIFVAAFPPSTAAIEYVVLLSGVVTDPPRAIAVPLTVIELLTNAPLGIFVNVFVVPDKNDDSIVLFVKV